MSGVVDLQAIRQRPDQWMGQALNPTAIQIRSNMSDPARQTKQDFKAMI